MQMHSSLTTGEDWTGEATMTHEHLFCCWLCTFITSLKREGQFGEGLVSVGPTILRFVFHNFTRCI